jgi:heme O synthase-like polyprenyltransferase
MSWQALAGSFLLLPVSVGQVITNGFSLPSSFAAGLLSGVFFYYSARLALRRSNRAARRLLLASIVYLPLVYVLFVLAKRF